MKIAFYHELHKGGARRGTNEFAKQLKKRGHQVDLYTIDYIEAETEFFSNIYGFKFNFKNWKGNDWITRVYKDSMELVKLFLLNKKIAKKINLGSYDLAYVTASQFIEAPFILNFINIKKFYYLNDPYYRLIYEPKLFNPIRDDFIRKSYEKVNRFFRKHIDRINVSTVDYFLAASDFTGEQFQRTYGIRNWYTAYYGVDTEFFTPKKEKKEIDLLYIGSKDISDGYPFFQEIVHKLNNIDLKIREVLVENEWLSDKDLRDLYRKSKILLALSYNEPLGLIPLESMACGTAVFAIKEGGYKETVLDGKTGYLIGPSSDEFTTKIKDLSNNSRLLDEFSKNSIKNAANWSWSKRGEELEKLLFKLTA